MRAITYIETGRNIQEDELIEESALNEVNSGRETRKTFTGYNQVEPFRVKYFQIEAQYNLYSSKIDQHQD